MRITHGFVHQEIITLINEAEQFLILITPYLMPWTGLTTAIERARIRGVTIFLVVRGGEEQSKHVAAAAPLKPFLQSLLFIERLHAKIYLSDKAAVMTSMNLVETSALNSIELATVVLKDQHPDVYQQAVKVCESLIATGEQDRQRAQSAWGAPSRKDGGGGSPRAQQTAHARAYCIRCATEIARNPDKPLCSDCYKIWSRYEDPDYREEHCHFCRRNHGTSMRRPLCRGCYELTV